MSTTTRKPATNSEILPVPSTLDTPHSDNPSASSATNPQIHKSNNPFPLRARCGKVARLPKEIRDQLNEMLLDGVPHAQIIQKLRQTFGAPAAPQPNVVPLDPTNADAPTLAPSDGERAGVRGPSATPQPAEPAPRNTHPSSIASATEQHDSTTASDSIENQKSKIENLLSLTPHHLTTWKKFGGYRDWLRDQQRVEECKIRHELTLDLARSAEGLASYQAAPKVAVAQICQTIIDLGPEGLKDAMKDSPLNCFRLLNALARLVNSGLKCEHQIQKTATESDEQKHGGLTRSHLQQIESDLNL